jgi:hypothetical protein
MLSPLITHRGVIAAATSFLSFSACWQKIFCDPVKGIDLQNLEQSH